MKLDTEDIKLGEYALTASNDEASDFATVTILKHGKKRVNYSNEVYKTCHN